MARRVPILTSTVVVMPRVRGTTLSPTSMAAVGGHINDLASDDAVFGELEGLQLDLGGFSVGSA